MIFPVIIAFIGSPSALAESGGLVVSPPFQEVVISNGDVVKQISLTLTNRTAASQTIKMTGVDFKSLNESGGVAFLGQDASELEKKYGLAKWLLIEQEAIQIAPGETKKINVTIDNRLDLTPGGHYGAVLFRVIGDDSIGANKVVVKQVFASLLFVKKLGGERYGLDLDSMEKPKNWLSPKQIITMKFKNNGNVHVVPRGTIELVSANNTLMAKANINAESGIILPEAIRAYRMELSNINPLKPGKYRLVATYRYDGSEEIKRFTEGIYIFDFRFALAVSAAILGVLAFVAFAFWYWRKRVAGIQKS